MSRPTTLRMIILVPLMVTLVAACGGAASPSKVPGATNSPGPTSGSVGSVAPGGAIPTFDLSALSRSIPGLDSYRTSTSQGGKLQYQTVVVAGPVLSKAITAFDSNGVVTSRIIVIGDKGWTADGPDGKFTAVPAGTSASLLVAYDPSMMLAGYASLDYSHGGLGVDKGVEAKNGIQARHLKLVSTTFAMLAASWPAGASIDIWVAETGYLVAWEMTGFGAGSDMTIEITNVNDPSNQVSAPQ